MTSNATLRANTRNNGTIKESSEVMIFFDLFEEVVINSLEDNRRIRRTATNAPPSPMLILPVMVTALVAAVMADVSISLPIKASNVLL